MNFKIDAANAFPDKVDNNVFKPIIEFTERTGRIIFFGDSYVQPKEDLNWTRMVCNKLNRQSWNYGRGGTSLLFSINNFFRYIENDYREDDYIIFVTTSYTRFPKVHPNIDAGISAALLEFSMSNNTSSEGKLYYENQLDLVAWLATVYCNQEDFRHQCLMLDNYLSNMRNKTIIIPAFDVQHWSKSKNFCLYNVTMLTNYRDGTINHMTVEQNKTLSEQCIEYLNTNDYSVFDIKEYKA